jgi:hypothetical protein
MAKRRRDVGPDPVWGVGAFCVGLLIMAIGGAATMHVVFNVGEGLMLIGAVYFLAALAIASLKREPVDLRGAVAALLRRGGGEEGDKDKKA